MKKSILVILIVLLAFTVWSVLAFGKAKRSEEVQPPTEMQKVEPGPAPEDFPEVVLPKPHPVRPTAENFGNMLIERKNKTPEQMKVLQGGVFPAPEDQLAADEKAPYYCRVRNQPDGAYYQPGGNPYLYCWGQIGLATYLDLDHNYYTDCPYPLYPFEVVEIGWQIYASDTCTIVNEACVWSVDNSGGVPYPLAELCTSDPLTPVVTAHPGAWAYITVPLQETCCVYEPFFAVMLFDNSDDFNDTDYCAPMYIGYALSPVFDGSGGYGQSYWNPYGTGGSWYDVVLYGMWSGALRVEAFGYTADQNDCPAPHETWYYKEGMPDFYQINAAFPNNGAAYCGPTAGANSIWWFACVQGDFPPSWGGCVEGVDEIALINEIAAASGTDPFTGTECDLLQLGIINTIIAHGGWWFSEATTYAPEFWPIQKHLRDCNDVILLLGFWQTPDEGASWYRFGGHFVTLAGVDIFNYAFAFSDPFTTPSGYEKWFAAWPSISPGGYIWLADYFPDGELDTTIICDPIPLKNHFKCWSTLPQTFDTTVSVLDQFMYDNLRLVSIECFSNPVLKVDVTGSPFDIIDEDHHLIWYRAEGRDTVINVKYVNQIELDTATVTIDSVMYFLVPSQKLEPIYHDPPESLDHYKAYRIKDPVTLPTSLLLEDQFDRLYGLPETIDVLVPKYFLTPASKDSTGIYDDRTHYVAYEIFPKRSYPLSVIASDQFGTHVLGTGESQLLLVPTTKCYQKITPVDPPWGDFQGQNFRAEHLPYLGVYDPLYPVYVEIEQEIAVAKGEKYMQGDVEGSQIYEVDNNYGGIADGDWYVAFNGADYVQGGYYGSYILGTYQVDHADHDVNCSYGDYHPTYSFDPLAAPETSSFIVTGAAGDYYVDQLTLKFKHTYSDIYITEYVFGFWVPEGGTMDCELAIEHVFVLENQGDAVTGLQSGMINDIDIGDNACEVDFDAQHNSAWMYETVNDTLVFGMTKKPAIVGDYAITGWGLSNPARIYDGQYTDSLFIWMQSGTWQVDDYGTADDKSLLFADVPFDLLAGEVRIEKWLKWGYPGFIDISDPPNSNADWRHFLYNILHQEGFYRGDANKDGYLNVQDVIYMINYLFKGGPKPIEFTSQMDVNCDGETNVNDVIYTINYLFKGGPPPIDKNRFFLESPYVDSAHKAAYINRAPGLFGDPLWKDLGK